MLGWTISYKRNGQEKSIQINMNKQQRKTNNKTVYFPLLNTNRTGTNDLHDKSTTENNVRIINTIC